MKKVDISALIRPLQKLLKDITGLGSLDVTSYIKHCQECQHQNKTNYSNMPRNDISASLQKNLA